MNKILLIGGSGFVGTRLVESLNKHSVKIVDKVKSHFYPDLTALGDVRDQGQMNKAIDNSVDTVVLLAAEHRDDVSPTTLYYDVNVQGAKHVLAAMNKAGVKRILFLVLSPFMV